MDGTPAFEADDDLARQILRSKHGRIRRDGRNGRHIQLLVNVGEVTDGEAPVKPLTMSDLRRGMKYVFRQSLGDGRYVYTLRDLPGIGIRFVGEPMRATERAADARGIFTEVLRSVCAA